MREKAPPTDIIYGSTKTRRRPRVSDFPADIYEFYLPYQLLWRYTSLCCCYNHHSLFHHSFSDDDQLYVSALASELHEIISFSQARISDVQALMRHNKTQTREKWFSSLQNISRKIQILPSSIQMNGCDIPLSTSVPNLGDDDDDDGYFCIALFSALEQTHSVRMWFYMSD